MTGLREKTKRRNQNKIIQSAKIFFTEKGFQETSMAEIARDAEVGTGTIYNYFPSKSVLLLAVLSNDFKLLQEEMHHVSPTHMESSGDVVEDTIKLLEGYSAFFQYYSKSFWKEVMRALPGESGDSEYLLHGLTGLDMEVLKVLEGIIGMHAERFLVPIDPEEVALAIYSVAATQTMMYLFDDAVTYDAFMNRLRKQVHVIFAGKI